MTNVRLHDRRRFPRTPQRRQAILDRVALGEVLTVTQLGKPVAILGAPTNPSRRLPATPFTELLTGARLSCLSPVWSAGSIGLERVTGLVEQVQAALETPGWGGQRIASDAL